MNIAAVVAAYILDLIFGDPRWFPHPVRGMGFLIDRLERVLYPLRLKRLGGIVLLVIVTSISFLLARLLVVLCGRMGPYFGFAASTFLIYTCISVKDLKVESTLVFQKLKGGDLEGARKFVSFIVGRDTDELGAEEIVRATVETIAESLVDGIVSPIFYALIGGAPLAVAYKAVNTLDSMVGHRCRRYKEFGWASAKIDEAANYIPARISAVLIPLAALICRENFGDSFASVLRHTNFLSGENSQIPEAAMAGALGVRLGGVNYYKSTPVFKRHLGKEINALGPQDILNANRIMSASSFLIVLFGAAALWTIKLLGVS
jgi:adenosylcobinamide-phosphate synthase